MAFAMERWNLHRRIALKILILFGISPGRILLGFMLATSFSVDVDVEYCDCHDDGANCLVDNYETGRKPWRKENG